MIFARPFAMIRGGRRSRFSRSAMLVGPFMAPAALPGHRVCPAELFFVQMTLSCLPPSSFPHRASTVLVIDGKARRDAGR